MHQTIIKTCFWIWLVFVLSINYSCTSSKKLLKRGNYYEAVMSATNRLKKSPGNDKAQQTLRAAYPLAVSYFKDQIQHAKASRDPWQWSITADAYQSLNAMYEAIRSTPKARQIVKPQPFYQEYGQVKEKAAMEQYNAGERALRGNTREGAKEAYFYFQRADAYVPGYLDVKKKMAESKEIATLKVVLEPVPVSSRFYKVSADFFYDQVTQYLRNQNRQYQFIAFYTPREAQSRKIQTPDHILRLQFEDFVVGQTNTHRNTETVASEDSVKVGEITLENGKKKPIYDIVSAKLITTRVEVISGGILSMEILDGYSQAVIHRDEVDGEFVWFDEWATYQGDERALNAKEKALCKRQPTVPPPPQDLFVQFTKPIYDQIISKLNRFYRGYA